MENQTSLKIDARLVLEGLVAAIAVLIVGINNIGLDNTIALGVGLILLAVHSFLAKLLGKSASDTVDKIATRLDQVLAKNTVLSENATPAVNKRAEEAAQAVADTKQPSP